MAQNYRRAIRIFGRHLADLARRTINWDWRLRSRRGYGLRRPSIGHNFRSERDAARARSKQAADSARAAEYERGNIIVQRGHARDLLRIAPGGLTTRTKRGGSATWQ